MKQKSKIKGITLIALVITIIVLLILAGVSIATLTGENGILNKANTSKTETERASAKEKVQMAVMSSFNNSGKLDYSELKINLDKVEGIDKNSVPPTITEDTFTLKVKVDGYEVSIEANGKVTIAGEPTNPSTPEEPSNPDEPNTEGKWDGKVNSPKLATGMEAVYWKEDGTEVTGDGGENWYDYKAGDNSTDTRDSHWANAKTVDGSYWVWIPRYEYKILSGEGTSTAGKIEVKFIPTTQTTADAGYKIHPAFQDGTSNNFKNGEWDSELSGIWVAKYEASRSDASISAEGTSTTMKILPGVVSWRNITIGDCYTKAYNYDRDKESHMMKNSEWGAVAYLTHSQYGRNGNEIDINNSNSYITGNGGGSPAASEATGVTNAYNTETGAKASTTGNIYGIYDLSGGAWERTAGYITNGKSSLSNGNSFVAKTTADGEGYKTLSTKYATVYPYDTISDRNANNYTSYKNAGYGYGEAILETSANGDGTSSWFSDFSCFPAPDGSFFFRGGDCGSGTDAGAFSFRHNTGVVVSYTSFRPVLAF